MDSFDNIGLILIRRKIDGENCQKKKANLVFILPHFGQNVSPVLFALAPPLKIPVLRSLDKPMERALFEMTIAEAKSQTFLWKFLELFQKTL